MPRRRKASLATYIPLLSGDVSPMGYAAEKQVGLEAALESATSLSHSLCGASGAVERKGGRFLMESDSRLAVKLVRTTRALGVGS